MPTVRLLVLLPLAACAVAPTPNAPMASEPGAWGERVMLEANAIPAAWLTRDLDGTAVEPDAEDAYGYGLRFGIGNRDQSIGVLAQGFHTDADVFDAATLGLDTDVRTRLDKNGLEWFFLRVGATLGGAWLDPVDDKSDMQLAAQLRLGIDVQPTERFLLHVGFGGLVFGHPGETEVYGTFVTVGGGLVF
jgi:hypothetical protein